MAQPIATGTLRRRIMLGALLYGIFFGLMPPYVMMIVVVATWGMPQLEPPDEQTFRAVYLLRLVLGNLIGLGVGALTTALAVHLGVTYGGKATWSRAVIGGALLGPPAGALTAASTSFVLLLSSSDSQWAWLMVQRAFVTGALMGLVNGIAGALVIVWFIRHGAAGLASPTAAT